MSGRGSGTILENLAFESELGSQNVGVGLDAIRASEDDERPLVVRNCTFRNGHIAIRVSGFGPRYDTPSQCTRIQIRDNLVDSNGVGVVLAGQVSDMQVVGNETLLCGNRFHGSAEVAVRFDQLQPGSGRIFVANNTIWSWRNGVEFSNPMHVPSDVTIRGNVIISDEGLDLACLHDNRAALEDWNIDHNWRKLKQPETTDPQSKYWIPASSDTIAERITFLSTQPSSSDFLRPAKGSPLAKGGAGGDWPSYAGALAPLGEEEWDWTVKWRQGIATPAVPP